MVNGCIQFATSKSGKLQFEIQNSLKFLSTCKRNFGPFEKLETLSVPNSRNTRLQPVQSVHE